MRSLRRSLPGDLAVRPGCASRRPTRMRSAQEERPALPVGHHPGSVPCSPEPTGAGATARQGSRRGRAAQRGRTAAAAGQRQRRENLIEILSVACPHCGAATAALCSSPKGVPVRALHQARRALAGVFLPKEFVLEEYSFHSGGKAPHPPLDGNPREILGHVLPDKTAQAEPRHAQEQQEAAERKLLRARRELWLASAPRKDAVSAQTCPACGTTPHTPCIPSGRGRSQQPHAERVDAAMEADITDTDVAEEQTVVHIESPRAEPRTTANPGDLWLHSSSVPRSRRHRPSRHRLPPSSRRTAMAHRRPRQAVLPNLTDEPIPGCSVNSAWLSCAPTGQDVARGGTRGESRTATVAAERRGAALEHGTRGTQRPGSRAQHHVRHPATGPPLRFRGGRAGSSLFLLH
ncbi:zinc finger domain-containing protein [Streptomyces sp. NPDC002143]